MLLMNFQVRWTKLMGYTHTHTYIYIYIYIYINWDGLDIDSMIFDNCQFLAYVFNRLSAFGLSLVSFYMLDARSGEACASFEVGLAYLCALFCYSCDFLIYLLNYVWFTALLFYYIIFTAILIIIFLPLQLFTYFSGLYQFLIYPLVTF